MQRGKNASILPRNAPLALRGGHFANPALSFCRYMTPKSSQPGGDDTKPQTKSSSFRSGSLLRAPHNLVGWWLQIWESLTPNMRGAVWTVLAAALFSCMATLAKFLGGRLDHFQVTFFRTLTGLMFIAPFLVGRGQQGWRTTQLGLHVLRGLFGNLGMICGFYALIHMPLADANAITFARALFIVPAAMIFLSETVGVRRGAATAIGFLGVLIMVRPTGTIEPAALAAVSQAMLVAGAVICVKILSRKDSTVTLLFYSSIIGLLITAIPAMLVWKPPTTTEYLLLLAMGAFGVAAHNCFIRGYSVGEASAMAPFDYTRLLFAATAGFVVFSEVPDMWTIVGAAIIVGSTLYIAQREAQLGKKPTPADPIDASVTSVVAPVPGSAVQTSLKATGKATDLPSTADKGPAKGANVLKGDGTKTPES